MHPFAGFLGEYVQATEQMYKNKDEQRKVKKDKKTDKASEAEKK